MKNEGMSGKELVVRVYPDGSPPEIYKCSLINHKLILQETSLKIGSCKVEVLGRDMEAIFEFNSTITSISDSVCSISAPGLDAFLANAHRPKRQAQKNRSYFARKYRLLEDDYREVWEEIRHIQACRSNIYVATIGSAVAAIGVFTTIAYTAGQGSRVGLIFIGSLLSTIFLTIGLLCVVEKAKAINIRKGFLMTIAEGRRLGKLPASYRGWPDLQTAHADCKKFRNANKCHLDTGLTTAKSKYDTCWTIGEAEHAKHKAHTRLFPAMTETFMSLSGYIYMFSLAISLVAMCVTVCLQWGKLWGDFKWYLEYLVPLATLGVGMVVPIYTLYKSHKPKSEGGPENDHRIDIIVRVALAFVVVALACVLAYLVFDYSRTNPVVGGGHLTWLTLIQLAALPMAFMLASYILFRALAFLEVCRIGSHSRAAYHYSWFYVLEYCHPERDTDHRIQITYEGEPIGRV